MPAQRTYRYRVLLLLAATLLLLKGVYPDTQQEIEMILEDIYTQLTEEGDTEVDAESVYENLYYFYEHPIQLNSATQQELEELQFLTLTQIDNILYYIYRHGPMHSLYELQLIEGLKSYEIRNLLPFVSVSQIEKRRGVLDWKEAMRHGKHHLLFRLDRTMEPKAGYAKQGETERATYAYVGDPFYTYLRYQFRYGQQLQFGIGAEKDAGEAFWDSHNRGYDSYSWHLQLQDMGRFKKVVAGHYNVSFGQGLVINSQLSFGKSSYVLNVSNRQNGLRKSSSTNEYNYLRGIGATVALGPMEVTFFYSHKKLDTNLNHGIFSTIYTTGLHRTEREVAQRGNVTEQLIGGNATYQNRYLQIGFTTAAMLWSRTLSPTPNKYNAHYFRGDRQITNGLHYRASWKRIHLFGESAITDKLAIATLNTIHFAPTSTVGLVILHRWYAPEFQNRAATAFGESSGVSNENGLYVGAEISAVRKWRFSVYADSYAFLYPKFGVDAPSTGFDYMAQVNFALNRHVTMQWRMKWEENSSNNTGSSHTMPQLMTLKKGYVRYRLQYTYGDFKGKNQLEVNRAKAGSQEATYGFLLSQEVSYAPNQRPLRFDVRLLFFDAVQYHNRLYSYESDVLYAFSTPMYYGKGARYYLNARWDLSKHLSVWLKWAQTLYADERTSIGTAGERIIGNKKSDIRLMARYKF